MFPAFFASSVELYNLHYKTWQMIMSGDVDSAALQEGPPSQSEHSMDLINLAIELCRVVCSPGHPGRSSTLNRLDISLHNSWRRYGTMSDLGEAIKLHASTLAHRHLGHFLDSSTSTTLPLALMTDLSSRSPV